VKEKREEEKRKALQELEMISQGATERSRKLLFHPLKPPLTHTHTHTHTHTCENTPAHTHFADCAHDRHFLSHTHTHLSLFYSFLFTLHNPRLKSVEITLYKCLLLGFPLISVAKLALW